MSAPHSRRADGKNQIAVLIAQFVKIIFTAGGFFCTLCAMSQPLVSVVISSKNGVQWLPRCFESLAAQTIFDKLEVVVVDNCSTDETGDLSRKELQGFPQATVIRNSKDLGYTGGNMAGAEMALGEYLFILSDDTKLQPDCLEQMIQAMQDAGAEAACPSLAEYDNDSILPPPPAGFDIFGRPTGPYVNRRDRLRPGVWSSCFMVGGAGFIIRRDVWQKLGGFDTKHFMYAEDDDLSWKFWLAGHHAIYARNAILHHRSSGGGWEIKESTRYLVNRNSLLVVAKNAQHVLLLCGVLQVLMLVAEGCLLLLITRNWKLVRNSYFKAIIDCARMWRHIRQKRKLNRQIRRRSDWEMARRFLRFRISRWDMVKTLLKGARPVVKPAA